MAYQQHLVNMLRHQQYMLRHQRSMLRHQQSMLNGLPEVMDQPCPADITAEISGAMELSNRAEIAEEAAIEAIEQSRHSERNSEEDVHFIKETLQKADGSKYSEDVPYVEFVLTNEDVAEASATMLILINDSGFRYSDVAALCGLGDSPETGAWFKSIFTVCETPTVISNGFRVTFHRETTEEAGVRRIVPYWADHALSDDKIFSACGCLERPTTVFVLPILEGKMDLVRKQLKDLCPETTLLLSTLRELRVSDKTTEALNFGNVYLKATRSKPKSAVQTESWRLSEMTVSFEYSATHYERTCSYFLFQQRFPVTDPVEERKDIHNWDIMLAFPASYVRAEPHIPDNLTGDVFPHLPTALKTGFPFILNADFILTASKEAIKSESPWNQGILACVPIAFSIAFESILGSSERGFLEAEGETSTRRDSPESRLSYNWHAYQFLPCNTGMKSYRCPSAGPDEDRKRRKLSIQPQELTNGDPFETVRSETLRRLGKDSKIFKCRSRLGYSKLGNSLLYWESNWFAAGSCWQIDMDFLFILEDAAYSNHPAPSVILNGGNGHNTTKFVIVDLYTQNRYGSQISALGVRHMTTVHYESFVMDSQWLLSLPEKIYLKVLSFFAFKMNALDENSSSYFSVKQKFRILKVRGRNSEAELVTFEDVSEGKELLYTSGGRKARWIRQWFMEFGFGDSERLMPSETSEALMDRSRLMGWVRKHGSLRKLTVESLSEKLFQKLMVASAEPRHESDGPLENRETESQFAILAIQFLYCCICLEFLSWQEVVENLRSLAQVFVVDYLKSEVYCASLKLREEGGVLLPPQVSRLPGMFPVPLTSRDDKFFVALSDRYLHPQCSLAKEFVSISTGPESMVEFLKQSFHAVGLPSVSD